MPYIIPNDATHAALVRIDFADGGPPDEYPVGFGTLRECDEIARTLPGVAYDGGRPVREARCGVVELVPFCETCGQRHRVERGCAGEAGQG
jgi:hypothetical protein